jgi:selenoprotein W-related protein
LTEELLTEFAHEIQEWTLIPGSGGVFEVMVNGNLVYSKMKTGRHPEVDEIRQLLQKAIGPE